MTDVRYLDDVDKLMKQLRTKLLGQNTRLIELMPPDIRGKDCERQANYLASRMLFILAEVEPDFLGREMYSVRCWLYESALYLLTECPRSDHDLKSWIQILNLPGEIRRLIFSDSKLFGRYPHLERDAYTPLVEEKLELAMLKLVPRETVEYRYFEIKEMCS